MDSSPGNGLYPSLSDPPLIVSDYISGLSRLMIITGVLTLATATAYWCVLAVSK